MRPLLYLLSAVLAVPALFVALFFEAVARAVAQRTLGNLVVAAARGLWRAIDFIGSAGGPIALLAGVAAAIGFVALAWSTRFRYVGFMLIAVVALVSTIVVIARGGLPRSMGEAAFHLPALVALALALWQLTIDPRSPIARGP